MESYANRFRTIVFLRIAMRILGRIAVAGLAMASAVASESRADTQAGDTGIVAVEVTDRQGNPVADVVVYAQRRDNPESNVRETMPTAVMDQIDTRFVPHILVAQTGTRISFPNHDTVSHHVYSFSEAKPFELPLYKGTLHEPLRFDEPGLIVLGCNIHDNMLGYIVVVDTPYFTKTDREGSAELEGLPAGDYSIHVWTPRLRVASLPAAKSTALGAAEERMIAFQFTEKLFPPHASENGALTWPAY